MLTTALLALVALLNGAALPAAPTATETDDRGAHHDHGGMMDAAPADDTAGQQGGCCQQPDCNCGCAAHQVAALRTAACTRGEIKSAAEGHRAPGLHAFPASGTPLRPPA